MFFWVTDGARGPVMASKTRVEAKAAEGAASTREHMVDVGLKLMRKHGYGATGLNEILQAAEVPKGSFYHHFGSKESFAAAVLERYQTTVGEHAAAVLGNTRQAPLKRLRRYFEELIVLAGQSSEAPGCLAGNLSLEVAGASAVLQGGLSAGFARWQTVVAAVLKEAMDRGELRQTVKPERLAGFVLNSWEGAMLRSQADQSDAPLKEFLYFVFEELLAAS